MKKFILLWLLGTFILIGCVKELHYVKTGLLTVEKIALIKEKVTTKDEISEIFGKPESNLNTEEGENFFYKDGNLKALWIEFDSDGRVNKYIFSKK